MQLHKRVAAYGVCNRFGARIPVNFHWNLSLFDSLLFDYEDREVVEWLRFGWPINRALHLPHPSIQIHNHKGATLFPQHIDQYLAEEIAEGSTFGPFLASPFEQRVQINPLNSRSKKSDPLHRRTILDLSWPPHGVSVNDGIPSDEYMGQPWKLSYPSVDDLADRIDQLPDTVLIFSVDMFKAFRQLEICPLDYPLLGMYWKGFFFWDCHSPMGLRSAALFCQRTTLAFKHIMNKMGYFLMPYLDDLNGCEHESKAWAAFNALISLLNNLKVKLSQNKTVRPTVCAEVLGVWFDTILRIMAVTPQRIEETLYLLEEWRFKPFATKKQLQSIIGKLQFMAKCVHPGRVLISRLLNKLREMKDNHVTELDSDTRADLRWWYIYLPQFSGVTLIKSSNLVELGLDLASDSSLIAGGAWFQDFRENPPKFEYIHCRYPQAILDETSHIAQRELFMVIITLKVWKFCIANCTVNFACDNQASVSCINSGRTTDKFMQACLREICFLAATHQFRVRATFITSQDNRIPDLLSRWYHGSEFRRAFRREVVGLHP